MDLQLNNRTCLITGASQGIGKGTARVMAAEGCRVVLLARRKALLEELADEIAETTPPAEMKRISPMIMAQLTGPGPTSLSQYWIFQRSPRRAR